MENPPPTKSTDRRLFLYYKKKEETPPLKKLKFEEPAAPVVDNNDQVRTSSRSLTEGSVSDDEMEQDVDVQNTDHEDSEEEVGSELKASETEGESDDGSDISANGHGPGSSVKKHRRFDEDSTVMCRYLDEDEDIPGLKETFGIPLEDVNEKKLSDLVVGRRLVKSSKTLLLVAQQLSTSLDCSARRARRHGFLYSPKNAFSFNIVTDEEDISRDLKCWCRIFTKAICSVTPPESVNRLQAAEETLRAHVLSLFDKFPEDTREYMESWKYFVPILQNWNLFAREMQIYVPSPERFMLVPVEIMKKLRKLMSEAYKKGHLKDRSMLDALDRVFHNSAELLATWTRGKIKGTNVTKDQVGPKAKEKFAASTPATKRLFFYYKEKEDSSSTMDKNTAGPSPKPAPRVNKYRKGLKDLEIGCRYLADDEDLPGLSEIFGIPLEDFDADFRDLVVGRRSIEANKTLLTVAENLFVKMECSARRTARHGLIYSPRNVFSLKIFTDNDEISKDLKFWCRIFTKAICSVTPTECIDRLQPAEVALRAHLLQIISEFPEDTQNYMKSWTPNIPILQNWNLFAREMQLYLPSPEDFMLAPTNLMNNCRQFILKGSEDGLLKDKSILDDLGEVFNNSAELLKLGTREIPHMKTRTELLEERLAVAKKLVDSGLPLAKVAKHAGVGYDSLQSHGIKSKNPRGVPPKYNQENLTAAAEEYIAGSSTYKDLEIKHDIPHKIISAKVSKIRKAKKNPK